MVTPLIVSKSPGR